MSRERRVNDRKPIEIKIDYRTMGGFVTDYSKNVSTTGLFVATSIPLAKDSNVRLRIAVPGRELPLALEGVVRWAIATEGDGQVPGMGIEFLDVDEATLNALKRFLATVKSDE